MRLLKTFTIAVLALLFSTALAPEQRAQARGNFGIGAMVGDPTGLSGKYYFTESFALDFGVGIAWWSGFNVHSHVDLLGQIELKRWSAGSLDIFFGGGLKVAHYFSGPRFRRNDAIAVGARGPIGVSWEFAKAPWEIFVEVAPGFWFAPGFDFDLDSSVGFRYYF